MLVIEVISMPIISGKYQYITSTMANMPSLLRQVGCNSIMSSAACGLGGATIDKTSMMLAITNMKMVNTYGRNRGDSGRCFTALGTLIPTGIK